MAPAALVNNRFLAHAQPGGPALWELTGSDVSLTDNANTVTIGADAPVGTEKFRVVGNALIEGDVSARTVSLVEQAGDPAAVANEGKVYTKDVATNTELFYRDSAGAVAQITSGGSLVASFDNNIPDNTTLAFQVREGTNNYWTCKTTNNASAMTFGNTLGDPNTTTFFIRAGQQSAWAVQGPSGKFIAVNTNGGTFMEFGNTGNNPEFRFIGDGPLAIGTAINDNSFLRIFDRTGDATAVAGAGNIYTKDISAITELFYRDDTSNVVQLTSGGQIGGATAAAYTRNATIVEDRTLLASASATTLNNNNVLAALIGDLQAKGIL